MVKIGVVGLGKMGLSHVSLVRPLPEADVVAVCDSSGYILSILERYTGVRTYSDFDEMLRGEDLDAVIIATPSRFHAPAVRSALDAGLHVFCEKPFCLDPAESRELAVLARSKDLVTQVGYHYRFVGAFQEMKSLLDAGVIGDVSHVLAEAYGPVVLAPKGGTWRSKSTEGGGCLYDYAAHPLDLLTWCLGKPHGVSGTVLNRVFSRETDDEVFSTLYYGDGQTAQLSVNWSDESQRKMTTRLTAWGTKGRIFADRQECQVYLRDTSEPPDGYQVGWNVRYTTDLTRPVQFYVRGEEYSAQLETFLRRIEDGVTSPRNDFPSAADTDEVLGMLVADAANGPATTSETAAVARAVEATAPAPWPAVKAASRELAAAAAHRAGQVKQRIDEARRRRKA